MQDSRDNNCGDVTDPGCSGEAVMSQNASDASSASSTAEEKEESTTRGALLGWGTIEWAVFVLVLGCILSIISKFAR